MPTPRESKLPGCLWFQPVDRLKETKNIYKIFTKVKLSLH
ncbi:hypothetical protein OSCI_580023 [Kamptonema sp. PCC 6506]|nr:hypothetical protein OSCI_580023 [Kamptonema sp. PCC 6506]